MKKMLGLLLAIWLVLPGAVGYCDTVVVGAGGEPWGQQTDCSSYTTEGAGCWDTDNNILYIGDGVAANPIGGSGAITVANEASDTTCFPLFATAATGTLAPKSNTGLTFNSSTATLSATNLGGTLTGSLTATSGTVNLPTSDADPSTTAGQIRHDNSDTSANAGGSLKYYDGAQVRTVVDTGTNYTVVLKEEIFPAGYCADGTAPPAAAAIVNSSGIIGRAFDGAAATEDCWMNWVVPEDFVSGIKFQVYYISEDACAANSASYWTLAGCAVTSNDPFACTEGSAVGSASDAANCLAWDTLTSTKSNEVTIDGTPSAGKIVRLHLKRVYDDAGDNMSWDNHLTFLKVYYKGKVILGSGY